MCHFVGVCLCVSPSLLKSEMCMMQLHRGKVRNASAAVQPDGRCEDFRQTEKERELDPHHVITVFYFYVVVFFFLFVFRNFNKLC